MDPCRGYCQKHPSGLAGIAVLLAVVLLATLIPAAGIMYFAGYGFAAWVNWLVKTRDQR